MTVNARQYVDYNAGFLRFETNTISLSQYTITNLNTKEVYTVTNGTQCSQTQYTPDTILTARSTEDLLMFGQKYKPIYMGITPIREIPCDTWVSYVSMTNGTIISNVTWYYNFSIQYFFSIPAWGFQSVANATQRPMRATVIGNRYTQNQSQIYYFNHNYEFVNFLPVEPLASVFTLPNICLGITAQLQQLLSSATGSGLAAGMFLLGLFIGAIICGVSIWVYCRRRQMSRDKFASSFSMQENKE